MGTSFISQDDGEVRVSGGNSDSVEHVIKAQTSDQHSGVLSVHS